MTISSSLINPSRTHEDYGLDLVRLFLGIALFVRGILFIADSSRIVDIVQSGEGEFLLPSVLTYVSIAAHLVGGLMLATGLLTRIAAAIQIPVLLGALYISTVQGGLVGPDQSLELSALVLFLLVIFFLYGSGRISADYLLFGDGSESEEDRLEQSRRRAERIKERIARLDEERRREEDRIAETERGSTSEGSAEESDRGKTVARVARYVLMVAGAGVILAVGIEMLPFAITATQIAITFGMLFLVTGFFFMFFSWALNDDDLE